MQCKIEFANGALVARSQRFEPWQAAQRAAMAWCRSHGAGGRVASGSRCLGVARGGASRGIGTRRRGVGTAGGGWRVVGLLVAGLGIGLGIRACTGGQQRSAWGPVWVQRLTWPQA
jgi:hypothetical protein